MTFTVEVEPGEVGGTWIERRSGRPFGIGLKEAASGPITVSMKFHRDWWDGSYQVELVTDRPANATTRRTGIRAPRSGQARTKPIR